MDIRPTFWRVGLPPSSGKTSRIHDETGLISYDVLPAVIQCILLRYPNNEVNIFLLKTAISYQITRCQNSEHDSAVYTLEADAIFPDLFPFPPSF